MDAPAASQRIPVSTISAGVIGTWGVFFFFGIEPVGATVMMSFCMVLQPSAD
jgi:hypothetical protein